MFKQFSTPKINKQIIYLKERLLSVETSNNIHVKILGIVSEEIKSLNIYF